MVDMWKCIHRIVDVLTEKKKKMFARLDLFCLIFKLTVRASSDNLSFW
jgi:hypothetical protein